MESRGAIVSPVIACTSMASPPSADFAYSCSLNCFLTLGMAKTTLILKLELCSETGIALWGKFKYQYLVVA